MKRKLIFQWGISSYFGWGVYGINLAMNGRADGRTLATAAGFSLDRIAIDAARLWVLRDFFSVSQRLIADLGKCSGTVEAKGCTVLHALGNNLDFAAMAANNTCLRGDRTLAVIFFEDSRLDAKAKKRAAEYELIIAGSHWNGDVLRTAGINNVAVVLQGVDATLFHPAPRADVFKGRFCVFSGGKLEYRKGQDLVLRGFKLFQNRHPEAMLITAWHSPWTATLARSMAAAAGVPPVPVSADGKVDILSWTQAAGIPAETVIDLGAVPNALMPTILREADAAVFTSRSEGGTNLVAMEAMACGVPVVLSANTGHLDLIRDGNCYPLRRQTTIKGDGCDGWGESDPEEIAEALETIYTDRETAKARAAAGAELLSGLSWAGQIDALMKVVGD